MRRQDWLLSYLLAPSASGKENEPIEPIRIMKGLFLMRMESGEDIGDFYEFTSYLYGPCSFEVYRDLRVLSAEGQVDELPLLRWSYYRLTPIGVRRAREIWVTLTDDQVERLKQIKFLVTSKSFLELLDYVYEQYPEYTVKSVFNPNGLKRLLAGR